MAYMKEIERPACYCGKRAVREVYNRYNALIGRYCGTHAHRRLVEAEAVECRRIDGRPDPHLG